MHLPYRRREPCIGQPAQEPRRRVVARARSQGFDEQDLHQPSEHEVTTRSLLVRLVADEPYQHREPLDTSHVHERWQQRHQQRGIRRVEDEVATEQAHVAAATARAVPDLARRCGRDLGVDALRLHGLETRHGEGRRRRQEDEVTRLEREGRIAAAIEASGPIDVLVNNAGIGLMGAFEVTPMATVRDLFETNTLGVTAMTQAVLPRFRARRSGVIVNVTSSATLAPMPLVAAYTASKMAIEGFTASLALELEPFGVRVKLVEPGYCPSTSFTSNAGSRIEGLTPEAYAPFAARVFAGLEQPAPVTREADVAEVVWHAANDSTGKLRFPAGPDAVALARST